MSRLQQIALKLPDIMSLAFLAAGLRMAPVLTMFALLIDPGKTTLII